MYHVTNIPGSQEQPTWKEVWVSVADDTQYDGELLGLPVACFTTTLWKARWDLEAKLPNQSPYPRYVKNEKRRPDKGTLHWRVDVSFDPTKYYIYEMAKSETQIHLLCLDRDDNSNPPRQELLRTILNKKKLADLQKYFPGYSGPNEYVSPQRGAPDTRDQTQKYFVNISFINPVKIDTGANWSTVYRNARRCGARYPYDSRKSNDKLLEEWGEKQLKSSWRDCIRSIIAENIDNGEQIECFMESGHKYLKQAWKSAFQAGNQEANPHNDDVKSVTRTLQKSSISDD